MEVIDGVEYCADIFDRHVKKGDELIVDKALAERSYFVFIRQKKLYHSIFTGRLKSDARFYVDCCEYIGKLTVSVPVGVDDRFVKVRIFGRPELTVEATVVKTGMITQVAC